MTFDDYINEQINKYIKLDNKQAKQKEELLIKAIKNYIANTSSIELGDVLVIKYFLMFLRHKQQLIIKSTWKDIILGHKLNKLFVEYLQQNNLWNDYVAQLLCIPDKDNIDWSIKLNYLKQNWLELEMYENISYANSLTKISKDSNTLLSINASFICEWQHLKHTREWLETDVSECVDYYEDKLFNEYDEYDTYSRYNRYNDSDEDDPRKNLSGIALMKYFDEIISAEKIMSSLLSRYSMEESSINGLFELYIGDKNSVKLRCTENKLTHKAKQYNSKIDHTLYELSHSSYNSPVTYLKPTDVKVVTISKKYNLKKLVITTTDGSTIHLLYDVVVKQINNDLEQGITSGSLSIEERILKDYNIHVEYVPNTKIISKMPHLSYNTFISKRKYSAWRKFYLNYINSSLMIKPNYETHMFNIDETIYDQNSKQLILKSKLRTEEEIKQYQHKFNDKKSIVFGARISNDNTLTIAINDVLVAIPYNTLVTADENNDVFYVLKDTNNFYICFDEDSEYYANYISIKYIPKLF